MLWLLFRDIQLSLHRKQKEVYGEIVKKKTKKKRYVQEQNIVIVTNRVESQEK